MSQNTTGHSHILTIKKLEQMVEVQKARIRRLERNRPMPNQALWTDNIDPDFFSHAGLYFVSTDTSFRITSACSHIEALLGEHPDKISTRAIVDYIHSDDRTHVLQICARCIEKGRQTLEYRMGKPDIGFRWVLCAVLPQMGGKGCEALRFLILDIDARKRIELKPAADEAKYRNIVESLNEGYFETDLEGRIVFCNQALLRMSGYDHDELIGKTFREVTTPRVARIMQATFGKVYKSGGEAKVSNYEVFHKSGHTLIVEFAAGLLVDARGEPIGFHGVLRDVSDQVKALEKQKQMQTQRIHVQKMDALGTLAGGLAHGFNNVLMAIQGNLSLIRMNLPADHPMQKHLERINQSTEKGGQLAREILSFAKIGKFVVMPTDLNSILKSTSRMFGRANSKLKIHELYQDDLWQTRVDRVQIGQVLLNLFMTAAEAMPKGGDLYLQSENAMLDETYTRPFDAKPGHYVKITVTDSGPGLDEEAKRRIFEPFFTAYRPLRYEGLGLAAVYGTVKSHNGIVNVYSEKGHGTTFSIYLPATIAPPPPPDQGEQASGNETILLVDDDEITARLGRDILERYGYRVMVVGNGNEAIDIYKTYRQQIRLVLLDIILPDLNGEQVYLELRRHDPNVRVVLTSGYNVNKHIQTLLKLGCVDFVQKPFQSELLSQKIRDALDRDIRLSANEYPLTWSLQNDRNGVKNDT